MFISNRLSSQSGFTMVELLTVVAIIAVLVGAGVPQYRRMLQKAKKAEAKILLGDIATAETAFFSEYGGYGNNILAMGASMDQNNQSLTYIGGFAAKACSSTPADPQAVTGGTAFPANIVFNNGTAAASPSNYTGYASTFSLNWVGTSYTASSMIGNMKATQCTVAPGTDLTGTTFISRAYGVIGTSATVADVWTIDQGRNLSNTVDGVNTN